MINSDTTVVKYAEAGTEFNKSIPYRVVSMNLDGKRRKMSDIEDFLYDEGADFIYCIGTKAYLVAREYGRDTDIVFSSIINWKRLPRTENTYGVSNELHIEMQMMLFHYIFPGVKKIGVLYSKQYNNEWYEEAKEKAKNVNIDIIGQPVGHHQNNMAGLKILLPNIDVLWLISDPVIFADNKSFSDILRFCDDSKVPVFSYNEAFIGHGATLIVSVDNPTIGRQAAEIAQRLISREKITDKVQYPAGSHIILNLGKVKAYGLDYNLEALAAVNQVIE